MKNTPKRKQRNKPGVVLFTAVAVMLMLSILLTATVSFVSVNRTKTNDNYKSKQAYLTASSTLESFINQIQTDTAPTNGKYYFNLQLRQGCSFTEMVVTASGIG